MSCTLSHECRVMLSSLLTGSTDATRVWLRAEMDRTVDPMLDSIFNRLTTKLTNGLEQTQSGDDCTQVVNRNPCLHDQSTDAQIHQTTTFDSISNQQLSSQYPPMTIKEEIEPMPTVQTPYNPVLYDKSNQNSTDQNWSNNDECINHQFNLADTEMQQQPQRHQLVHIKHNEHDDEECDCEECFDGGIEVKEEDEEHQENEKSSQTVKRPRLDTTQPNNAQTEVVGQSSRLPTDETQLNEDMRHDEEGDRMGSEQSEALDTQTIIEHYDHGQYNSDESMVIQQEERDANNAIGEESIATECTTNQIQQNIAQPNRHLQCSHCLKSFDYKSHLQQHLRMHTGERPFQCDQCGKRFSEKCNLTRHQRIHQNIKPFQCDQCDTSFNDKSNLAKHQLIHQNIKRFRCHQCEKQFTHKCNLDAHLRVHSGERPFKCGHCDMSFTKSHDRTKHQQAIHLHINHRCKQCGHTATERASVIKHIRIVHFGLPKSIKQQRALNIIDDRDSTELVEKV